MKFNDTIISLRRVIADLDSNLGILFCSVYTDPADKEKTISDLEAMKLEYLEAIKILEHQNESEDISNDKMKPCGYKGCQKPHEYAYRGCEYCILKK